MTCHFDRLTKIEPDYEGGKVYYYLSKHHQDSNGKVVSYTNYEITLNGRGTKSFNSVKLMSVRELMDLPDIKLPKRFSQALLAYAIMKLGK